MTTPVFILGLQRSGTTWLGNLLAAHPDVAVATDPAHHGIHESVFFSHFARAWDWTDGVSRATALRAFAASDYGRLIGAEPRQMARTTAPAAHFVAAMEAFAQGRAAWVEKSPHHTRLADAIARDIPDARFICVTRGSAGLIASRLHAYDRAVPTGLARKVAILRGAVSNAAHVRYLTGFARRMGQRATLLRYEDLVTDRDARMGELLGWLNLRRDVVLSSGFVANSSFTDRERPAFTTGEQRLIALSERLGRCIPTAVLRRLPLQSDFPAWVWSDPNDSHGVALAPARRRVYE